MTIFITGATGVVGPVLVRELLGAGHTVRVLVRDPNATLLAGLERVAGDLGDEAALARGVDGADAVVHLAAQLHVNGPAATLAGLYREVNVEGTRRLVDAARAAGVGRFVFASTINVYGPSRGRAPWTESDALNPDTLYGETKRAAEPLVRDLIGSVVLRLAAVYGPGMKGNYPSLMAVLRRGVRVLPGDGQNRRTLIHVGDAARAFALAAAGGVPAGTYNLTDGQVHRFDDVVRSLQAAAGVHPGVRYVPSALVRGALRVPEVIVGFAGRSFPGPLLVDKMTEDVAVSGDALMAASTYRPQMGDLANGWLAGKPSVSP
jgi:UDP-glucose 4-epimerase